MSRVVNAFRGEVPLMAPRALPDNAAQAAVNARLYTGDLTAFRQFSLTHGLANPGPVQTISLMAGRYWLSWNEKVDIARGAVPGDTTYRTYLTGLDAPRFTNLTLATGSPAGSGPEPYPIITRLLGVPAPDAPPTLVVGIDPTATTFSIDTFDDCADITQNWVTSAQVNSGGYVSLVTGDPAFGNPLPSFRLSAENNRGGPAFAYRDFGTKGASVIRMRFDAFIDDVGGSDGAQITALFACGAAGDGARILAYGKLGEEPTLGIATGSGFGAGAGATIATATGPGGTWVLGVWYSFEAIMVANADGTSTITAALYLGSAQLATVVATNVFTNGGSFGPICGKDDDLLIENYDNFHVQASGSTGVVITNIATNYVYTFVNDLGEESGPSLPSATILRPDGVAVTVTTPTGAPTGVDGDYHIATKRIYRAATGSTGTAYRFVAEIPINQANYVDTLTDAELGEVLQSDLWELPPSDLQGILALPNGVMVGFRRNQLCFSAQNHPHAWPIAYRLNTDTDIVGIGNIDTTVVIGTQSFLYVASGNDPANYSMSKFEVPHAASSKRSFAYITGLGVVFSGPDGLMVCAGIGQVRNLTQTVFTRRQWQGLSPSSIFSVAHNDIYFMFWEAGSQRGCYAVDLRANGFGIVEMAFHASAAYVDPVEDKMYLVLDYNAEPDDPSLPVPPELPAYIDSRTIYEFEGNPVVLMTYRWRSKLWLMEYPGWYSVAQVRPGIDATGNLLVRFYGDGVMLDEIVVEGDVEFTLTPPDATYNTFEMEVLGTDTVRVLQAADDVAELT
jgi:hypothetical protein